MLACDELLQSWAVSMPYNIDKIGRKDQSEMSLV